MGAQCVTKTSLQCVKKVLRESSMRKEGSLWVFNVWRKQVSNVWRKCFASHPCAKRAHYGCSMCEESKSPMCEESAPRVFHAQRGLFMGAQCV